MKQIFDPFYNMLASEFSIRISKSRKRVDAFFERTYFIATAGIV